MNLLKKIIFFSIILSVGVFARNFNNNELYKTNLQFKIENQINQLFNKYKYQTVVKDKNLIYYRPDKLKIVPPKMFYIWTRANITSIDNGKFYYIIPEGYRIVYQKEGEIYIESPDGTGNSNIEILNNLY